MLNAFPKIRYRASEKRPLTSAEKKAVFTANLQPMDKAFLYLIYGCGLRREEALALYKSDFNEKYVKGCKTARLFTLRNGQPMTKSSYDKMWKRILKEMNEVSDEPIEGLIWKEKMHTQPLIQPLS